MNLLFTGDIMPGGVLPYQKDYITTELKTLIGQYDLRIGTLEAAVGESVPFEEIKMQGRKNVIHCRPKDLKRLTDLNFEAVSLANNHIYDLGKEGLISTIKELDDLGIKHCGAGMNLKEASTPMVIDCQGKTIAVLAYCQCREEYMGYVAFATPNNAGVNPLDITRCEKEIKEAKNIYDYVFVMPHWGKEYEHFPIPEVVEYSKRMIRAGADGVFGSHTHQIQPLVKYHGKPIAYSMGNFLFPDYYMKPPRPLWYPPKDLDTSVFDKYDYYPGHIEKPCIQIWRPAARIGMIVECVITGPQFIHSIYHLINLSKDNILCNYSNCLSMRRRMGWMGKVTMMMAYPIIRKAYYSKKNIIRRGYHFLKRIL